MNESSMTLRSGTIPKNPEIPTFSGFCGINFDSAVTDMRVKLVRLARYV
jgi:hypothetical protein